MPILSGLGFARSQVDMSGDAAADAASITAKVDHVVGAMANGQSQSQEYFFHDLVDLNAFLSQ